ncbi:MAG: hypothetical protein A4E50_00130 [Methanosaeta sp. PtaB.Bin087]|nr:MAG: hypothetical protein A4E50_00130 [Methanosaeta sp. PtaB.Bin087]
MPILPRHQPDRLLQGLLRPLPLLSLLLRPVVVPLGVLGDGEVCVQLQNGTYRLALPPDLADGSASANAPVAGVVEAEAKLPLVVEGEDLLRYGEARGLYLRQDLGVGEPPIEALRYPGEDRLHLAVPLVDLLAETGQLLLPLPELLDRPLLHLPSPLQGGLRLRLLRIRLLGGEKLVEGLAEASELPPFEAVVDGEGSGDYVDDPLPVGHNMGVRLDEAEDLPQGPVEPVDLLADEGMSGLRLVDPGPEADLLGVGPPHVQPPDEGPHQLRVGGGEDEGEVVSGDGPGVELVLPVLVGLAGEELSIPEGQGPERQDDSAAGVEEEDVSLGEDLGDEDVPVVASLDLDLRHPVKPVLADGRHPAAGEAAPEHRRKLGRHLGGLPGLLREVDPPPRLQEEVELPGAWRLKGDHHPIGGELVGLPDEPPHQLLLELVDDRRHVHVAHRLLHSGRKR